MRYPLSAVVTAPSRPKVSKLVALGKPRVLFFLIASTLFMMVTNVPMMFVAKFATDIGMKPSDQALALSLVFGGSILSTFASGWLSDRGFTQGVMGFEAILSSAIHFLLLGFSKAKVAVFTYAICIGIVGGGYANSMIAFYAEVSQGDGELFTAIHSLFSFFNGAAILSVGPLGTYLLRLSPIVEMEAYAIGKYKYLVIYAGTMTMTTGLLLLIPLLYKYVGGLSSKRKSPDMSGGS